MARTRPRPCSLRSPGPIALIALLGCAGEPRDAGGGDGSSSAGTGSSSTGADEGEAGDDTGATTTGSTSSSSGSSSSSAGDDDGDDESSGESGGIRLDVPDGDDGGSAGDEGGGLGCKKVDFLFVVDNSSSMFAHQEALAASFPGFIQAITERVDTNDFHVMVIDTDTKADPSDGCGECYDRCVASPGTAKNCGFNDPNDSGAPGVCNGMACADITPEAPDACDYVLGAGVIDDRWEQPCALASAKRYMTKGEPDLAATFQCVGQTGVYGTGKELPMGAMVAALDMNDPGECNEGFLRDDAILVIVILSDALYEVGQPAQPWYDAVVAAKLGHPENVVVLGLFRANPATLEGPACQAGAATCGSGFLSCDSTYPTFVDMFGDRGFKHSICIDDYVPFVGSALDTIEITCDDFVPPG